jgi:hypothetical protein
MRPGHMGHAKRREGENVTHFVQKINNVNVKRLLAEVLADHLEDRPFQNERVVNGHETNTLNAIPARLAAAGDARVHNVIGNEEVCLHL